MSRVQWLNLHKIGFWGRPVIAAGAAGLMVGAYRRDDRIAAMVSGAFAALLSLWAVYGIVRLSVRVMFIERSIARVVASDLLRLAVYAVPAGVGGAAAAFALRTRLSHLRGGR